MKKTFVILLLLAITSAISIPFIYVKFNSNQIAYEDASRGPWVNDLLAPYTAEFKEECKNWKVKINKDYNSKVDSMLVVSEFFDRFGYPDANTIGRCYPYQKRIEVLGKITDPKQLKLVMFHELGHCVLDLRHTTEKLAIMNPSLDVSNIDKYYEHWDELLKDFFSDRSRLKGYMKSHEEDGPCQYR